MTAIQTNSRTAEIWDLRRNGREECEHSACVSTWETDDKILYAPHVLNSCETSQIFSIRSLPWFHYKYPRPIIAFIGVMDASWALRLWTRQQPISHSDTRLWCQSNGKTPQTFLNCTESRFRWTQDVPFTHDRPKLIYQASPHGVCQRCNEALLSNVRVTAGDRCAGYFLMCYLAVVIATDWQHHHSSSSTEQVLHIWYSSDVWNRCSYLTILTCCLRVG